MAPNKTLLWLDDKRDPHTNNWLSVSPIQLPYDVVWVKSYSEFCSWIIRFGLPTAICFDHDLGKNIEEWGRAQGLSKKAARELKQVEKTGMDCAKWLSEWCMDEKLPLPLFKCHSSNPDGNKNIVTLLTNHNKHA